MAHSSQNPLPDGTYAIVTASEFGYKALASMQENYGTATSDGFSFTDSMTNEAPKGLLEVTITRTITSYMYALYSSTDKQYIGVQNNSLNFAQAPTTSPNASYYWEDSQEGTYLTWVDKSTSSNNLKLLCQSSAIVAANAAGSSYKPVSFVRKTQAYQRELGTVKMGTICVPCDVRAEDIQGCTCFEVLGTTGTGDNQVIHLGSVDSMKAGLPYIYVGDEDASQVKWTYSGQAVSNPGNKNGLYGTFEDISSSTNFLTGKYLLTVDSIGRVVFGLCADGSSLSAKKAYLILDKVTQLSTAPSAPGRQLLSIGSPNMGPTTMLDECRRVECYKVEKVWIRGQWVIRRGNKMYTLYGQPITGE